MTWSGQVIDWGFAVYHIQKWDGKETYHYLNLCLPCDTQSPSSISNPFNSIQSTHMWFVSLRESLGWCNCYTD